mgnify:FL=1
MELKLPEQIDVIDITMRDGLQNEEHYVPPGGQTLSG